MFTGINTRQDFVEWYLYAPKDQTEPYLQNQFLNKEEQVFLLEFINGRIGINEVPLFNAVISDIAQNDSVSKELMFAAWNRAHQTYLAGSAVASTGVLNIVLNKHILKMFEETEFSEVLAASVKHYWYCTKIFERVSLFPGIDDNLRRLIIEKDSHKYFDTAISLACDELTPSSLLLELVEKGNPACIQLLKWNELPDTVFEIARIRHNIDEKIPNKWIPSILGWT